MVNEVKSNWPIVPVHTPNSVALRKDSAVRVSSERNDGLINDESKVPPETFYLWEKGKLIDIFA